MIVRKIIPEEVRRTEELFSVAFNSSYKNEETPLELYQRYQSAPENREQEHCLERFAAFEDDGHTMMSCFIMQPFSVFFDGRSESMFSIGGVATLPQYRSRGGVRACFESALPYLYDKGAVFSYLYPFSTAFYRKFGYEICCRRHVFQIDLSRIPAFGLSGSCYLLEAAAVSQGKEDIPYIYNKWQTKYNMMVTGTPYDYRFIESADPFKDQEFTYVYRSASGEASGYMSFRCETGATPRGLICSRFFYLNAEALKGLLSLAKGFASDYSHIRFALPEHLPLEPMLPEWSMNAVVCESMPFGMVRVINVGQALQDARYLGGGHIRIGIADPCIASNNGTFQVVFENGRCTEIAAVAGNADIELSISSFSAFITGCHDSSSLSCYEDVKIHGNMDMIAKVFYKKPIYIATSF